MYAYKIILNARYGKEAFIRRYTRQILNAPINKLVDELLDLDVRAMNTAEKISLEDYMKGGLTMDKRYKDIHITFKNGETCHIREVKNPTIYTDEVLIALRYEDHISLVRRTFVPEDIKYITID